MKFLHLLHSYMKGIRLTALAFILMMTWAVFCGITTYGRMQNIQSDLDLVEAQGIENAYFLTQFVSQQDLLRGTNSKNAAAAEEALEADFLVKNVFSIRTVPASYNGQNAAITLYEPEMLEFFPGIVDGGMDFSANPNGCILGTLEAEGIGDEITLSFSGKKVSFPVTGRLSSPFRHVTLDSSGFPPVLDELFTGDGAVFMLATDPVEEQLGNLAKRIKHNNNRIIVFQSGTTAEQREELIKQLDSTWQIASLSDLIAESKEEVSKTFRQELPLPLFLLIVTGIGFLSIIILIFRNKQQQTALMYLCGGSRLKCGLIGFTALQLISSVPLILNAAFIYWYTSPLLPWNALSMSLTDYLSIYDLIDIMDKSFGYLAYCDQMTKVNSSCYIVLL